MRSLSFWKIPSPRFVCAIYVRCSCSIFGRPSRISVRSLSLRPCVRVFFSRPLGPRAIVVAIASSERLYKPGEFAVPSAFVQRCSLRGVRSFLFRFSCFVVSSFRFGACCVCVFGASLSLVRALLFLRFLARVVWSWLCSSRFRALHFHRPKLSPLSLDDSLISFSFLEFLRRERAVPCVFLVNLWRVRSSVARVS